MQTARGKMVEITRRCKYLRGSLGSGTEKKKLREMYEHAQAIYGELKQKQGATGKMAKLAGRIAKLAK